MEDEPEARRMSTQDTTAQKDKDPCDELDSNSVSVS
jgi:hypothetical protein